MNDDERDDSAFGRGGWFWEGLADGVHGIARVLAVLLLIAAVFIAFHVVPAWMSRNAPPTSCAILGGHWDLWNGWTCG